MPDNKAYAQLGGNRRPRPLPWAFLHLQQPEVFFTVVQTASGKFLLDLHNPTAQSVAVQVKRAPLFDLAKTESPEVRIPAGGSVVREVE